MSTSFFIGPVNPSVWYEETDLSEKPTSGLKIDPDFYRSELLKKWPFAKVVDWDSGYIFGWNLDTEHDVGSEGGLQCDYQHVSFNYSGLTFVDFILWH
jgi:hypothetical protein